MTVSGRTGRSTGMDQPATGHAEQLTPATERPGATGEQGSEHEALPNPSIPGTVFLRGAGASRDTWQALEQSMHRRGYMTVRDRTQAWHLARAGAAVVMVDFSNGATGQPTAVTVARVRARWRVSQPQKTVSDLLIRAERERLAAAGATWLSTRVIAEVKDMELPVYQDTVTLTTVDPEAVAEAVDEQLRDGGRPVVDSPELAHPGGEPS